MNTASNLVNQASAAADFATASKLLGSGLKSALKADSAAAKCAGGGGSSGGGDFMKATITGDVNLNFSNASQVPPVATWQILAGPTTNIVTITGATPSVGVTVGAANVTGPGAYPVVLGSNVSRSQQGISYISLGTGMITFTTVDFAGQKLAGTFHFTGTDLLSANGAMVTVTNGSFSVSKITVFAP